MPGRPLYRLGVGCDDNRKGGPDWDMKTGELGSPPPSRLDQCLQHEKDYPHEFRRSSAVLSDGPAEGSHSRGHQMVSRAPGIASTASARESLIHGLFNNDLPFLTVARK